jgi:hypothetical protein
MQLLLLCLSIHYPAFSQSILGRWRVTAGGIEYWDINTVNNQLVITEFSQTVPGVPLPFDRRQRLLVESFQRRESGLYLSIRRWGSVTMKLFLNQIRPDRMEGTATFEDRNLCDLGMVEPPQCIVNSAERVVMIRLQ